MIGSGIVSQLCSKSLAMNFAQALPSLLSALNLTSLAPVFKARKKGRAKPLMALNECNGKLLSIPPHQPQQRQPWH
eukprot:16213-Heterococcus_DN1.PRE.4